MVDVPICILQRTETANTPASMQYSLYRSLPSRCNSRMMKLISYFRLHVRVVRYHETAKFGVRRSLLVREGIQKNNTTLHLHARTTAHQMNSRRRGNGGLIIAHLMCIDVSGGRTEYPTSSHGSRLRRKLDGATQVGVLDGIGSRYASLSAVSDDVARIEDKSRSSRPADVCEIKLDSAIALIWCTRN